MDKNPFIGSISCDDRHQSANKVRNADHVTTRSEVKALFFLINLQFFETTEILHRLITNKKKM